MHNALTLPLEAAIVELMETTIGSFVGDKEALTAMEVPFFHS